MAKVLHSKTCAKSTGFGPKKKKKPPQKNPDQKKGFFAFAKKPIISQYAAELTIKAWNIYEKSH